MATVNIATRDQSGYDYEFIKEPPDDLTCLICLSVARDPQQHGDGGCGKIFCRSCIKLHKKTNNKCPNCWKTITTFKDERSEREIQSLKVKCTNHKHGCEKITDIRGMDKHHEICDFTKVTCPNNCKEMLFINRLQVTQFFRKDLKKHVTEYCLRRKYNCRLCSERDEYKYITSKEHIDICPKRIIACPNDPNCRKTFPQDKKYTHLLTCQYEKISCKYSELGCRKRPFRKYLSEHENDDKAHLHDAMKTVLPLKKQCRFNLLRAQLDIKEVFQFKMPLFAKKRKNDWEFLSNPFYTHPEGYKLTTCIDANGSDKYKGTHVSVWVYLMRGEYDDQLEFPFKGTITFELLNQLEDKNHHSKSYTHDGTKDGSKRVMHNERSSEACGVPDFISHEGIYYDAFNNCQYLKGDCLVFRVSVSLPSYKPWLHCP